MDVLSLNTNYAMLAKGKLYRRLNELIIRIIFFLKTAIYENLTKHENVVLHEEIAANEKSEIHDIEDVNAKAEMLFDAYGNMILRLAYSYLHNMADAEEILQETLIKYLQAVPAFEGKEHEKAWLLHVASNLSKNKIKYNGIRETDELNEELVAQEREDLSFVWAAVKDLPEKYRETIHLFYYEGLSTRQIAEALERKESTVRSDLKRGRERLKQILKEEYDFAE